MVKSPGFRLTKTKVGLVSRSSAFSIRRSVFRVPGMTLPHLR